MSYPPTLFWPHNLRALGYSRRHKIPKNIYGHTVGSIWSVAMFCHLFSMLTKIQGLTGGVALCRIWLGCVKFDKEFLQTYLLCSRHSGLFPRLGLRALTLEAVPAPRAVGAARPAVGTPGGGAPDHRPAPAAAGSAGRAAAAAGPVDGHERSPACTILAVDFDFG